MSQTKAQLLEGKAANIEFSLGSASTPGITFTGDTNTGIYSPGADQVAISTGGTGRLFVGSDGTIKTSGTEIQQTTADNFIRISGSDGAGNGANVIVFGESHGSAPGRVALTAVGTGAIIGSTGGAERLRITAAGLVGIGTSSPSEKLEVAGNGLFKAAACNLIARDTGTNYAAFSAISQNGSGGILDAGCEGAAGGSLVAGSPANAGVVTTRTNHPLLLGTNGTERLRITSAGLVGIGTSGPSFPLHVVTSGNSGLAVYAGTAGANQIYLGNTAGESVVGTLSNQNFGIIANGGQKVTVTTGGNVGIGSTAPQKELQINAITPTIRLEDNGGGSKRLELSVNSSAEAKVFAEQSGSQLLFGTIGTERARIDSSGRLLVGTSTSRTYALYGQLGVQIESTGFAQSSLGLTNNQNTSDGASINLAKTRGTSLNSTTIVSNSDVLGSLLFQGADGGALLAAAAIYSQVDGPPGVGDMPGRLVFSTTRDNQSSPTEACRIDSSQNLLVGTTTAGARLAVASAAATVSPILTTSVAGDTIYQAILVTKFDNNTTTSQNFIQFQVNNGGANCGRITANGANTAAFGSTSDIRLKENIADLPPQLQNILNLRPVEFDYIQSEGGGHQIGFIAQEMQAVYPDVVNERGEDDMLMITGWSKTEARLVRALQEAVTKIETLEARLTAAGID